MFSMPAAVADLDEAGRRSRTNRTEQNQMRVAHAGMLPMSIAVPELAAVAALTPPLFVSAQDGMQRPGQVFAHRTLRQALKVRCPR